MEFKTITRTISGHTFMLIYPKNFLSEYRAKRRLQLKINKFFKEHSVDEQLNLLQDQLDLLVPESTGGD